MIKTPLLIVAALVARGRDDAVAAELDSAARVLADAGADLQRRDTGALVVARDDDADTADLIRDAGRFARAGGALTVRVGCAYGVRIGSGRPGISVSDRSVQQAIDLARAAAPGMVLVASQLGSLLTLSERGLPFALSAMRVMRDDGGGLLAAYRAEFGAEFGAERGAEFAGEAAAAAGEPAGGPFAEDALRTLPLPRDARRRARLADQLSARLSGELGPAGSVLLARLCEEVDTARQLADALLAYLPPGHGAHVTALVVAEIERAGQP